MGGINMVKQPFLCRSDKSAFPLSILSTLAEVRKRWAGTQWGKEAGYWIKWMSLYYTDLGAAITQCLFFRTAWHRHAPFANVKNESKQVDGCELTFLRSCCSCLRITSSWLTLPVSVEGELLWGDNKEDVVSTQEGLVYHMNRTKW